MFEDLIKEYRETGAQLRKVKTRKVKGPVVKANEVTLINSMISEVGWAVAYMRDGFNPDATRGIHSREISMDPAIMDSIFAARRPSTGTGYVDQGMMDKANEILDRLTPREREAFLLVKVELKSHGEAANIMGISRGNVYTYLISAEKKINHSAKQEQLTLAFIC